MNSPAARLGSAVIAGGKTRHKAGRGTFRVMEAQSRKGGPMSSERMAWVVTNMDDLLEADLLIGGFLPLLLAAAITYWQRRPR